MWTSVATQRFEIKFGYEYTNIRLNSQSLCRIFTQKWPNNLEYLIFDVYLRNHCSADLKLSSWKHQSATVFDMSGSPCSRVPVLRPIGSKFDKLRASITYLLCLYKIVLRFVTTSNLWIAFRKHSRTKVFLQMADSEKTRQNSNEKAFFPVELETSILSTTHHYQKVKLFWTHED